MFCQPNVCQTLRAGAVPAQRLYVVNVLDIASNLRHLLTGVPTIEGDANAWSDLITPRRRGQIGNTHSPESRHIGTAHVLSWLDLTQTPAPK